MSATVKLRITSETAAHELWRVAEAGDVDELGRVCLRGADVNARNKHGMTALMRAACHGHEQMVRALLERGADPNSARNDRFTALALAAFFGHTETVRILIEHGARTEVITRCGASAKMWAISRTYEEVARCLESHAPARAPVLAIVPVPTRPAPAPAPAPAVKTLKDPPEIWDLVHEVPRGFNARSAFVARLKSMKTSFALAIAAVMVVAVGCVVGALMLRGSQARNLPAKAPANQTGVAKEVRAPVNAGDTATAPSAEPSTPEVVEFSHHSEASNAGDKRFRKAPVAARQPRSRATSDDEPLPTEQSSEVPAAPAPTVATPPVEPPKSNKQNTALSPQLITPAKSATPKAKVIQWP